MTLVKRYFKVVVAETTINAIKNHYHASCVKNCGHMMSSSPKSESSHLLGHPLDITHQADGARNPTTGSTVNPMKTHFGIAPLPELIGPTLQAVARHTLLHTLRGSCEGICAENTTISTANIK